MHVITGLYTGGAERMLSQLVLAQHDHAPGLFVVSLLPGGPSFERLVRAGVPVVDLGMKRGWPSIRAVWRLTTLIRREKPNVIQSWMYHADLIAAMGLLLSGRRRKTRLYWGVRCSNMDSRQYSWTLRFVIKACAWMSRIPDAVIANSEAGGRYHLDIGYYPHRLRVIDNGVDTELFRPDGAARDDVRREIGLDAGAPVVALIARRDPMKDHATFFKAMEQLPGVVALLVGSGTETFPDMPRIVKLGERLDVPRLLCACDLIVLSSAFGEGFSNALIEGMACGLPAVATDVGDARRIVGDAGLIVPPEDPASMAKAIKTLLDEPVDAHRRRGGRARQRVVERFSLAGAIRSFGALYEDRV